MKLPPETPVQQEVDVALTGGVVINIMWAEGYAPSVSGIRFHPAGGGQEPTIPPETLMILARIIAGAMDAQTVAARQQAGPSILRATGPIGRG